jgi:hypothetical protein
MIYCTSPTSDETTMSTSRQQSRPMSSSKSMRSLTIISILCYCTVVASLPSELDQRKEQIKLPQQTKQKDIQKLPQQQQFQQEPRIDSKFNALDNRQSPSLQQTVRSKMSSSSSGLTAVIHIGPMKTGSSAIQESLGDVVPEIETIDHYEDAGFAMDDGIEAYHMIGCFRSDAVPYTGGPYFEISCHPDALNQVRRVADRNHNLIITAEYLTDPKTDLKALKQFLQPWSHHKIVAYYRRYYDWLLSFHNQVNKQRSPVDRKSVTEFVTNESKRSFFWKSMYLIESVNRYAEYFNDIEIINIYDIPDKDVRRAFYCDALPHAEASCQKFMKYLVTTEEAAIEAQRVAAVAASNNETMPHHLVENPSVALVYSELAYYAKEMNLWHETTTSPNNLGMNNKHPVLNEKYVTQLAQQYQEVKLNKTSYDFGNALVCPEPEVFDWFLQKSLDVEKQLFPTYYYRQGRDEIMAHFHSIRHTKMCHVNATIVLQSSPEWRDFFMSLNSIGHDPKVKTQSSVSTSTSRTPVIGTSTIIVPPIVTVSTTKTTSTTIISTVRTNPTPWTSNKMNDMSSNNHHQRLLKTTSDEASAVAPKDAPMKKNVSLRERLPQWVLNIRFERETKTA